MRIHEIQEHLKLLWPDWLSQDASYRSQVERYVNSYAVMLDIGCGRSSAMCDIYSRAQKVIGQDLDTQALAENPCVQVKLAGGFEALESLEADSIDLAVSSWVLEHIDNPDDMFLQLKRILKRGGRFISLTPNKKSLIVKISRLLPNFLHPFLANKVWGRQTKDTYPTKYKLNSVKDIQRYAKKYFFEVEQIELLKDPTYYVTKTKNVDRVLKFYNKFIKPDRYEGIVFILKKL